MGTVHMHFVVYVSPEVVTRNVNAFLPLHCNQNVCFLSEDGFSFCGLAVFSNLFDHSYLTLRMITFPFILSNLLSHQAVKLK